MNRVNLLNSKKIKRILTLVFLCVSVSTLFAQSTTTKVDTHNSNQNVVIRIENNQNGWVKGDNDATPGTTTPTSGNENVSFNGTSDGIYVTIISGTNKLKLFALTGQLLFNGILTEGHFLIKARTGIYFLKINSKSYKVICK